MSRLVLILLLLNAACSSNGQSATGSTVYSTLAVDPSASNVMQVSVGTGICDNVDEPCTSVTICNASNVCTTINDVLIDTGSTGLRLFNTSALQNLGLPTEQSPVGGDLAECFAFLDGTSDWGSIVTANVKLGGETALQIPIQIIDSTYATVPASCHHPDTTPAAAHFNGILGVSSAIYDCNPGCIANGSSVYFACSNGNCSSSPAPLYMQVVNPGSALPSPYNDGVILSLPDLGQAITNDTFGIQGGSSGQAYGWLIFGIQTSTFVPPEVEHFAIDSSGNFNTTFEGTDYPDSFIDSGSNGLYFPNSANLPLGQGGFFDPSTPQSFSATQSKSDKTGVSALVNFEIIGASYAFAAGNPDRAFNNIGAPLAQRFDWGLPFFFGHNVRVGFETSTDYGYWSY
jgi:hypothetical protein